jgi:hypothetical protein
MIHQYFTVNAIGRAEIVEFLNKYHKRPADQRINAWVEAAESNMTNNGSNHANIEIRFFDAVSGHVESLTLEGDALTTNEIEE